MPRPRTAPLLALGLAVIAATLPGPFPDRAARAAPSPTITATATAPASVTAHPTPGEQQRGRSSLALVLGPGQSREQRISDQAAPGRLRFYTPNLIAPGADGTPPRDTEREQIDSLFTDEATTATLLRQVDVFGFFGTSLARADSAFEAMLGRAIPMLERNGVKLGLEVGGPLGYAPPTVYGGDTNGQNGVKSAKLDLGPTRIGKIERLGGSVDYLMLDGALRRTIVNGEHSAPHAAYVGIGAGNGRLRYTAVAAGREGNAISVAHVAGTPGEPLGVTVDGTAITVRLATDATGKPVSTAAEVQQAIGQSSAAAALVNCALAPGSDGSGAAAPAPSTALAYGDDGLNMSIEQSVAEVVAYIATVHAARSNIRFVLLENTILWPYEGVAGYQSTTFPSGQRPEFDDVWEELIAQLDAAGLRSLLVGMHNDHPVEYPERLIPSINRDADDWYDRTLRLQQQVEADGVAFAQMFNSVWGGDPAQDAKHAAPYASDEYFQQQVLTHVRQFESYRLEHRPGLAQSAHFAFDAFLYYPRVVGPSTIEHSTDDTYLDALALFESYGADAADAAADVVVHAPEVALVGATRAGRGWMPVSVSWADPAAAPPADRVQLQRRQDGGSWIDVALPGDALGSARLRLAFGRRHELRVRAIDASGSAGPWLAGDPFEVALYDQLHPSVEDSGPWRQLSSRAALGGSYDRTKRRGSQSWLSVAGEQLAWIGQRGPRHGRAEVIVDGQSAGYVPLRAGRTKARQVLYVSSPGTSDSATTLAVRNASRRLVDVDAFAVLRHDVPPP